MERQTLSIPVTDRLHVWLPDYIILGVKDYKCFLRRAIKELMESDKDNQFNTQEDRNFQMRLRIASLTTQTIILSLMRNK